ncbi:MAG: MGH1-like glycoside hydrolase domain-containing protein, partial [Vitreimonas sp.]
PELAVSDDHGAIEDWSRGFGAMNAALFLNLHNPDALSPLRYARPAPAFRAIYLWDSAFIAQVWKWWDAGVAWDVLNAVVRARDGQRLQHFVSEFAHSDLTQPPLIAWSLQRLGEAADPQLHGAWLNQAYRPLRAYHEWLRANRRLPSGLYAWAHAYESGVENAPRFGDREERRLRDTSRIAAPDLCAYVVLQCEALAAMARAQGEEDDAGAFTREGDELRRIVNTVLWDEREGYYFDRDSSDGSFIRSRAIASLMPLWAGIPDAARAARLVEHILDPGAFNTLIPLPSVAIGDIDFERDMWRGPVWVNTAFAVIDGLRRYGYDAAAADFAYRLCDGVYRTFGRTGRFYEFYDPTAYGVKGLNRKYGNRWKAMTLGRKPVIDFVGWTGLVNTLVIETLFGLRLDAGNPVARPRFPKRAAGRSFALTLPLWNVSIGLKVFSGEQVGGEIRSAEGVRAFRAGFGDTVPLSPIEAVSRGAMA